MSKRIYYIEIDEAEALNIERAVYNEFVSHLQEDIRQFASSMAADVLLRKPIRRKRFNPTNKEAPTNQLPPKGEQ